VYVCVYVCVCVCVCANSLTRFSGKRARLPGDMVIDIDIIIK